MGQATLSLTNRPDPSNRHTFTPPGCALRAAMALGPPAVVAETHGAFGTETQQFVLSGLMSGSAVFGGNHVVNQQNAA